MDISKALELISRETYGVMADERLQGPSIYTSLCEVVSINPNGGMLGDQMTDITGMGDLEEIGDSEEYPEDSFQSAWTRKFAIPKFARRLRFSERDIAAVDFAAKMPGMVQSRVGSWRTSWQQKKEQKVADMFNNGALTAGHKCFNGSVPKLGITDDNLIYDGDSFFSLTHPLATDANADIANFVASAALSASTLKTGLTAFKKTMAVDERNRRYLNVPRALLVAQELEYTAAQLLGSAQLPGGDLNDINSIRRDNLGLVVNPYLTGATTWALVGGGAQAPLRAYDSGALRARVWFDDNKKDIVVDVDGFFGVNVKLWNGAYGANFPTS